jgi:hypothetical protein
VSVDLGLTGYEEAVEIGRGGFGRVYRARQPRFKRIVAIKVLTAAGDDGEAREDFERELQALGTLSGHPNIVTVHDAGITGDGLPYIVMGFEAQGSIADYLAARGPLPWPDAAAVGIKIAGALETAHRAGVLHRDIKPENILISTFGEPKLADFGIAQLRGTVPTRAASMGTVYHAAPEVLTGVRRNVSTDVYALGSTVFTLMSGKPPFVVDSKDGLVPVLYRIAVARPRPPLVRRPGRHLRGAGAGAGQGPGGAPDDGGAAGPGAAGRPGAPRPLRDRDHRPGSGRPDHPSVPGTGAGARGELPERSALIGRDRDVDEIHQLIDGAGNGQGALVLISGEAGIGKTRLAEESADHGRRRGFAVHWGASWDGAGQPSLWPWMQVVRSVVEHDPGLGGMSLEPAETETDVEAERLLANAIRRLEDRAAAEVVYPALRPYEDLVAVIAGGAYCQACPALELAALASLLGRYDDAEDHLAAAARMGTRMRAEPWLACTAYEHARMLSRRGGPGDATTARELLAEARDAAGNLGMELLELDIDELRAY